MAKKPTINPVANTDNNASAINGNLNNLADAFDNTLSLDGSTPNDMNADLDLNGYDLLNVKTLSFTSSELRTALEETIETIITVTTSDFGQKIIKVNSATGSTITVPIAGGFVIGDTTTYYRKGTGTVTFVAMEGVTIESSGGLLSISEQYGLVTLSYQGENVWMLFGGLG